MRNDYGRYRNGIGCALDRPASTNTGGSVRVVGDACGGVSADTADVTRG